MGRGGGSKEKSGGIGNGWTKPHQTIQRQRAVGPCENDLAVGLNQYMGWEESTDVDDAATPGAAGEIGIQGSIGVDADDLALAVAVAAGHDFAIGLDGDAGAGGVGIA